MRRGEPRLFWERFLGAYPIKATALLLIAALLVVGCGKEGGLSRALSKLNYDSLPAKAPRPTKPAERLHAAVRELKGLLAVQGKRRLSDKQAAHARAARAQILTQLRALDGQFKADAAKLRKLGAKAALARLHKIEARTAGLERSLQSTLARVPRDGQRSARPTATAAKVLTTLSPDAPEQPLSSDLSFGIKNARPRPVSLSASITPAYNSPSSTEVASELPRTPESADLAETPDTALTPALRALAEHLGGDPVKIYEYVRNNIQYEPYYGIRKGANETFVEKGGSDADQAALLTALLRASGIHARFVRGVAELPAATAASWLGVDTAAGERVDAVPEILANGGIPTSQVRANGQLTKVRFDHVWAEAYVPNAAYRGAEEGIGGKGWVPLDPSIKASDFHRPTADVTAAVEPVLRDWTQRFQDGMQPVGDGGFVTAPGIGSMQQGGQLVGDVQGALQAHGVASDTKLVDVIGDRSIHARADSYLPSSTPFRGLTVSSELRGIPPSLTSSVSISVTGSDPLSIPSADPEAPGDGGFSYTASTSDLAGKRITLAYVPATDDDAAIVDAYHGLLNGPSYGASLIPVLRVGGTVVARGHTAVSTGYTQRFTITYHSPGYAPSVVENPVSVGGISALSLDLGTINPDRLAARGHSLADRLGATPDDPLLTDGRIGELFDELGDLYFLTNDRFNEVMSQSAKVAVQRQLSGAIVATDVSVAYVAGFPVATQLTGASFDVDQDVLSGAARGTPSALASFARGSGALASSSEANVLGSTMHLDAVSTTTVIQKAMADQVPVYSIDDSNLNAALARISAPASAKAEIRAAVTDDGARVVIPERPVSIGGWTGVGYMLEAGNRSEYRIQGGASGGTVVKQHMQDESDGWARLAAEEAANKAEACQKLKLAVANFAMMTFALVWNLWWLFALGSPIGAAIFGFLWLIEFTLWLVDLWDLVDLWFECTASPIYDQRPV